MASQACKISIKQRTKTWQAKAQRLKQRTRTSQARPVERPFASPPSSCHDRWCLLLLLGEVVLLLGDVVLLLDDVVLLLLGDVEDSSAPLS